MRFIKMSSLICIWKDLSLEDVVIVEKCASPQQLKQFIRNKFELDPDARKLDRIMLDLYYYTLAFAKEKDFTKEQTSALFSIVKKTHEKAIETPYGNSDETFTFFKDTLACHTVKRPPFCIYLFDTKKTQQITEYVLNTYFRHFKLYKYAFTSKVVMNLTINYNGLIEEDVQKVDEHTEELQDDSACVGADEDTVIEEKRSEEDSPAVKELKNLIKVTVDEQINKLRSSVEHQLKANEDMVMKKLTSSQNGGANAKSPRKGKKK